MAAIIPRYVTEFGLSLTLSEPSLLNADLRKQCNAKSWSPKIGQGKS